MELNPKYGPPEIPFSDLSKEALEAYGKEIEDIANFVAKRQKEIDAEQRKVDDLKARIKPLIVNRLNSLAEFCSDAMSRNGIPYWDGKAPIMYRSVRGIDLYDFRIDEDGVVTTTRVDMHTDEEYTGDKPFSLAKSLDEERARIDTFYNDERVVRDRKKRYVLEATLEEYEVKAARIRQELGEEEY